MINRTEKLKNNLAFLILVLSFCSIVIGFIFNEDSTGGAKKDYLNQKNISIKFSQNLKETLLNYDKTSTRHSPIIPMYFSIFEKYKINDFNIRLSHLVISFFVYILFYICLKKKYSQENKAYLSIFACLVFLSPTVRSLAIWPDSRVYGVATFLLSVLFYLHFINEINSKKKLLYASGNIVSLAASSYISPNFAVFSIFFFLNFIVYYKFSITTLYITALNIILAFPAFYYLFTIGLFFLETAAIAETTISQSLNPFNKLILISSLFFFYFLPFFIFIENKKEFCKKMFNINSIFIASTILIISIYYFSYSKEFSGGGIFFHLSQKILNNNILLFIISFFSILLLIFISKLNKNNLLLIFLIFLGNPQLSVYHKYYDPLIWILLTLLFNIEIKRDKVFNLNNISVFYIFAFSFLIISLFK